MAGIHAEEVNRLKAGLFRGYHRTVHRQWDLGRFHLDGNHVYQDFGPESASVGDTTLFCRVNSHLW
jgi:hypothetical protein